MNDRELDQAVRQWERLAHKTARDIKGEPPGGLTYEDLVQEARIGIFKGLRAYDSSVGVPLINWLARCAKHEVLHAFVKARTLKQRSLNLATTAVTYRDGDEVSIFDRLEDDPEDRPDHVVEQSIEADDLRRALHVAVELADLTPLEARVVNAFLKDGGSWEQVGSDLGVGARTVRHAMNQAEAKIAAVFQVEQREAA